MLSPSRALRPLATTIAVLLTSTAFTPAAEVSGGGGTARTGLKPPERVAVPKLAPASNEWQSTMKRFQVAPNFTVDLWAAEPMLGNPVAFTFDNQGRAFVSETYRYRTSTLDIRHYMFMLEDDLANRTTDDRIAEIKKNFPDEWQKLGIETEVVRLVQDSNRDGKADQSSEYAAGMNTLLDGINSGVLAHDGQVWTTNMPNLWQFSGITADGKAEKRESLSFGYGVRFSFTGHDMHGLILGPDGRLYFSFGDRGAHVVTKEGKTLAFPDEGAVFRCEPDGSRMEVVAHGLRNPQELAFDNYGNLFTGDNDSDQGDRERWEYIVDGADYGWRVGWQHNPLGKDHNPWLAERMWEPRNDKQPAYVLPPIANIPDGPSGLAYYPGTGLPSKFEGKFFLCGFKGSAARSAISSWGLKPKGASFDLVDQEVFVGSVQATDVCFGPDSKVYFSEWGEGWEGTGRGRIFSMWDAETIKAPQVAEVQKLLADGFAQRPSAELAKLLSHGDQRIRLEAQWALAKKADGAELLMTAASGAANALPQPAAAGSTTNNLLARLHGIWGVAHAARLAEYRQAGAGGRMLAALLPLLNDPNEEVRAQAAKVLGEGKVSQAAAPLVQALKDPAPRVQFLTALALAKLNPADLKEAAQPVLALLRSNADADAYLRHAGAMALANVGAEAVALAAKDESASVRMAALLAMRNAGSAEIAQFLQDKDAGLVYEAVRAINDAPIAAAMPQLAALLAQPTPNEQFAIRVVNANFRLGTPAAADALATYAGQSGAPEFARVEALRDLGDWHAPFQRDRVVGTFRPLPERDAAPAVAALRTALPKVLAASSSDVAIAAIDAVAALKVKEAGPALLAYIGNKTAPAKARIKALGTLAGIDAPELPAAIKIALTDKDSGLRIEASAMLGKLDPDEAARQLTAVFSESGIPEKKAIISALGGLKSAGADKAIMVLLGDLRAGKIAGEAQLELLEAAAKRNAPEVKTALASYQNALPAGDLVAAFQPTLLGGDAVNGEKVFKEHAVAQCFRCHKVGGVGGEAGPELTGVGTKKDRAYILESIINPSAKIAEGFQMVMITPKKGDMVAGVVKSETDAELVLVVPDAPAGTPAIHVAKADIGERANAPSSMPPGFDQLLTRREIRDLVEYVASLK